MLLLSSDIKAKYHILILNKRITITFRLLGKIYLTKLIFHNLKSVVDTILNHVIQIENLFICMMIILKTSWKNMMLLVFISEIKIILCLIVELIFSRLVVWLLLRNNVEPATNYENRGFDRSEIHLNKIGNGIYSYTAGL